MAGQRLEAHGARVRRGCGAGKQMRNVRGDGREFRAPRGWRRPGVRGRVEDGGERLGTHPGTQRPLPLRIGEEVQAVLPREGRGEGPGRACESRGGSARTGRRGRGARPRALPRTRRDSPGRRRRPTPTASARPASPARSEAARA